METTQFIALAVLALLLYGTPGPATLSLAASGAAVGFWRSFPYLAGIVMGLLANFLVALLGLTVLMEQAPAVATAFRYVSFAYILYLAFRMLKAAPIAPGAGRALKFGEGALVNLINPKAYVAALAVLSQFGQPGRTWILVSTVVLIGLLVDLAWCFGGAVLGRSVASRRGNGVIQVTLVGLLVTSVVVATFWS